MSIFKEWIPTTAYHTSHVIWCRRCPQSSERRCAARVSTESIHNFNCFLRAHDELLLGLHLLRGKPNFIRKVALRHKRDSLEKSWYSENVNLRYCQQSIIFFRVHTKPFFHILPACLHGSASGRCYSPYAPLVFPRTPRCAQN